jgi:hypothetical protein
MRAEFADLLYRLTGDAIHFQINASNVAAGILLKRREDFMNRLQKFTVSVGSGLLAFALIPSAFAAKAETLTGTVSDAMCGAKHMMEGDGAACLRACVQKGSNYALIVGDKVYTLDTKDKATLDTLDKLANAKATVKGAANGDTIEVTSVVAAK